MRGGGEPWPVPRGLLCMFLGCVAVYCALLGTGHVLYGDGVPGYTMLGAAVPTTWMPISAARETTMRRAVPPAASR